MLQSVNFHAEKFSANDCLIFLKNLDDISLLNMDGEIQLTLKAGAYSAAKDRQRPTIADFATETEA